MQIIPLTPLMLATRNPGKARELAEPLAEYGFAVRLPPPDLPEVEETGTTFEENALLKARAVAAATGYSALADDSGLEVDDLDGQPGVRSARYGEDILLQEGESKDQRNNRKLLAALAALPSAQANRRHAARFHCCMALVHPPQASGQNAKNSHDVVAHGVWEGSITPSPRGDHGFGYDPIFLDATSGRAAAELSLEEKQAISHRGKALRLLLNKLTKTQR